MKIFHLSNLSHGWIDVAFGQESDGYTIIASDVPNDCLCDLASATLRLLAGSTEETVEFSLEPGSAICRLHRDSDSVQVVVTMPNQKGPVFDAIFPLSSFAKRLRFELLRIKPLDF